VLILHDLEEAAAGGLLEAATDIEAFAAKPAVRPCLGCFGCWLKTPGVCVIADRGQGFAASVHRHSELVVVSQLTYGGFSPAVKAVMDRCIGHMLPYFRMQNGEMHHRLRYCEPLRLRYLFYGEADPEQRAIAERLARANAMNLAAQGSAVAFHSSAEQALAQALSGEGGAFAEAAACRSDPVGATALGRPPEQPPASAAPAQCSATLRIALLNGSPKPKGSGSGMLLDYLQGQLPADAQVLSCQILRQGQEAALKAIEGCNAIVIAFPLYVDSLPSHLISFLLAAEQQLAAAAATGKAPKLYILVNNGFYEAGQNAIAVSMAKLFAARAGLQWGSAYMVGAGGMLGAAKIGEGPFRPIGEALGRMAASIAGGSAAGERTLPDSEEIHPSIPRFAYFHMANLGMRLQARSNGVNGAKVKARA